MKILEKLKGQIINLIFLIVIFILAVYAINPKLSQSLTPQKQLLHIADLESGLKEKPLIEEFQFIGYNSGKKVFTVDAKKFYLRNRKVEPFGFRISLGKSAELEVVEVTFYKDDKPVSYLHSKSAIMDTKRKNFLFQDEPYLITEDKRTLSAQEIIWNNSQNRLSAKDRCILGAEGKIYFADSVNSDIELKNFTLRGQEINNS